MPPRVRTAAWRLAAAAAVLGTMACRAPAGSAPAPPGPAPGSPAPPTPPPPATPSPSTPDERPAAPPTLLAPTTPTSLLPATPASLPPTTPASLPPAGVAPGPPTPYAFPFAGRSVSYSAGHHEYPAADVFGCGAEVRSPVDGRVDARRAEDRWDPATDDPADRGGIFVSVVGDDGVRYYFSHLAAVTVEVGEPVTAGSPLGVMGQTGNARASACHTHVGISRPCTRPEWAVRRGEIWPQPYLDAWAQGEQRSPVAEVWAAVLADPDACSRAAADPSAARA